MKSYARWANGIGLPIAAGLTALGWYLSRMTMVPALMAGEVSHEDISTAFTVGAVASMAGMLGGGMLSVFATPWVALLLGLVLTALGVTTLGLGPNSLLLLWVAVGTFGRGMSSVALYGALARALPGPRAGLRDAAFITTYVFANMGALASMGVADMRLWDGRPGLIALVAGTVVAAGLIAAGIVSGISLKGRDPDAPKPALRTPHLLAVLGLIALVSLPVALGYESVALTLSLPTDSDALRFLNPAVVIVAGLVLATVRVGLHMTKLEIPSPLLVGAGLLLAGAGNLAILIAVPADGEPSTGLALAGTALAALGEVMILPMVISRISADLPYRLGALGAALFMIATQVPGRLASLILDDYSRGFVWGSVVLSLLVGLVIAAVAYPTRKLFIAPDDEGEDAPTAF